MSKIEKEMNEGLTILIGGLFFGIVKAIRCMFRGAFQIRGWQFVGLLLSFIGAVVSYTMRNNYFAYVKLLNAPEWVQGIGYYALLLLPTWYLMILGMMQELEQERYRKEFEAVGFKSKDGKYPFLLRKMKDKKGLNQSKKYKEVYFFKSNIPLSEWMGAQERIETALDRNIVRFSEGNSKKTCKVITVPSEYKIPEKINWNDTKLQQEDGVVVIGESALETIQFNLNQTPHVLAAGETGSGKSVILRTILWQFISKGSRVYMFDFKGGVEFGKQYDKFGEVVTDRERAVKVLEKLFEENQKRLTLFRELEVKNLAEYNHKTGKNLCRIGVFCDEIAEMLDTKGASKDEKQVMEQLVGLISSLARLSRATGINLFLGVQRPDANVLTGQIKNNIPVRICGRFADKPASEIVLGNTDAVYLPEKKGRFLFRLGNTTEVFQAYYFDDQKHLHSDVPKQGQMLIDGNQEMEEVVEEQQDLEGAAIEVAEQITKREEKKAIKAVKKYEKKAEKLANTQGEFDFTWSCEGKEIDD